MADVPSFAALKSGFPYKPHGTPGVHRTQVPPTGALTATNVDLLTLIGGDLLKALSAIYRDLSLMNTCAVRLSYCLNKAGDPVRPTAGVRMKKGADGKWYAFSADEMIAYLRKQYGKPKALFDGQGKDDTVLSGGITFPTQGIIGYDWQGRIADFGATGHVDIARLPSKSVVDVTDIGTGAYFIDGAMKCFLWEAPL